MGLLIADLLLVHKTAHVISTKEAAIESAITDDPVAVLAALAEVERTAEHEARLACLSAPPGRTGLLGSITAARATHAEVLTWSE